MTGWALVGFIFACWCAGLAALVLGLLLAARWLRAHPYRPRPLVPPAHPRARHLILVNKNAACGVGAPRRQTAKGTRDAQEL